jgi:hypothetical protein
MEDHSLGNRQYCPIHETFTKVSERANTAGTRLVGVATFSGSFLGLKLVRQSGLISSRPPAGNAYRWAATITASAHQWLRNVLYSLEVCVPP